MPVYTSIGETNEQSTRNTTSCDTSIILVSQLANEQIESRDDKIASDSSSTSSSELSDEEEECKFEKVTDTVKRAKELS